MLAEMCEIKVYNENDGNKIIVNHGIIVLQGSLKLGNEDSDQFMSSLK